MFKNHVQERGKEAVLNEIYEQIQLVYKSDQRPWVIGYSGGKDSTLTCMLVFEAISRLPENERHKEIHVVSSDTMVENPLILDFLNSNIVSMNHYSETCNLKVTANLLKPDVSDSFWVLLIGKGYPSPRQKFRWCTSRLKIKPIDEYINDVAKKNGSVIVVLGVRSAESNSRAQSIKNNTIVGKILKTHKTNSDAFVYAPIEHLSNDDVWSCLLNSKTPWGTDTKSLLSLYMDASDESECPIQQDTNAPSCGQSRFGCWTCTVVSQDKSLTGFINNGYDELRPLLRFRNELCKMREQEEYRQNYRMNGSIYFVSKGEESKRGLGPFNLKARKRLLEMLLNAQKDFNNALQNIEHEKFVLPSNKYHNLIQPQELEAIRQHWINDGDWQDSLPLIYKEIFKKDYYWGYINQPFVIPSDMVILENICLENDVDAELVKSLITIENKFLGIKQRNGIYTALERALNKDIVHEELLTLGQGED